MTLLYRYRPPKGDLTSPPVGREASLPQRLSSVTISNGAVRRRVTPGEAWRIVSIIVRINCFDVASSGDRAAVISPSARPRRVAVIAGPHEAPAARPICIPQPCRPRADRRLQPEGMPWHGTPLPAPRKSLDCRRPPVVSRARERSRYRRATPSGGTRPE